MVSAHLDLKQSSVSLREFHKSTQGKPEKLREFENANLVDTLNNSMADHYLKLSLMRDCFLKLFAVERVQMH